MKHVSSLRQKLIEEENRSTDELLDKLSKIPSLTFNAALPILLESGTPQNIWALLKKRGLIEITERKTRHLGHIYKVRNITLDETMSYGGA